MSFEIKQIDVKTESDKITHFYQNLREEKETFQLPLDQILKSFMLFGVENDQGELIALSGLRKKSSLAIFFVVVGQEFQGRGLGKQLTQSCFDVDLGGKPLLLSVENGNKKAQALYRNLGMETVFIQAHRLIMMKGSGFWKLVMRFFQFWLKPHRD